LCGSKIIQRIVSDAEWAVDACKACTNAWTVPSPGEIEYAGADFHASVIKPKTGDSKPLEVSLDTLPVEWRRCIVEQSNLLSRHLPQRSRILEIGCGEGILLAELSKLGFRVEGIEPSESASLRARKKGLNVATGFFPSCKPVGEFDAVIISHVLEHLPDPVRALEAISAIAPGGYLFLIQTHYKGVVPRWDGPRWYAWSPKEHFWHFTPGGLNGLAYHLGFRAVACEFSSLVHGERKTARLAARIARLFPAALDQFHLLMRQESSPSLRKLRKFA
jgi:SAM-dependent methyltransferase